MLVVRTSSVPGSQCVSFKTIHVTGYQGPSVRSNVSGTTSITRRRSSWSCLTVVPDEQQHNQSLNSTNWKQEAQLQYT